jgi:hypothetical protein
MREISFEIRSFLKEYVQSVWQLDLLILMLSLNEPLDIQTLSRMLYLTPAAIEFAVYRFARLGLVIEFPGRPATFLLSPEHEKRRILEDAAKAYSARRVDVINLIFANPPRQSSTG